MKRPGSDPFLYRFTSPPSGHATTAEHSAPVDRPGIDLRKVCYKYPGVDKQVVVTKELLSRFRGTSGRGTMVLIVNTGELTRTHEVDIITRIRASISGWCDPLPGPQFHTRIATDNIAHIDKALKLNDCDIRVFITKRFEKIWSVRSVDEFKRVFLDYLECHYHAWNTAKNLHRNISENNLMIYPPDIALDLKDAGSGKVQTAPSRGVLNDLELSELEPDENIQRSVKSHHHAGTFPFMARDLLARARYKTNGPANCHLYRRYDLESFYYMLIWAALTYTTQGRSCKAPTGSKKNPLKEWLSPDPKTVYYSKLILQGNDFNRLGGKVSREWVGLWEDWVEPLNRMFSKGLFAADQAPRNADANFDTATCDGLITFERFMDVIQEHLANLLASIRSLYSRNSG